MIKKLMIKSIAFLLIFGLLFLSLQEVLRYKFAENLGDRYRAYMNEAEDSVDVVFIGSSTTYAGIVPPVMWRENGITAYNFGLLTSASLISYYQLRFLLEVQTQKPKLVVFGFTRIGKEARADKTVKLENAHRKAVEAVPFWDLKKEMIFQIKKDNPGQNIFTYFFPLLRYHSRWNDIQKKDFIPSQYDEYTKGALFSKKKSSEAIECRAELFEAEIEPVVNDYSLGYYKKIVDLCKENDIEMAVACYPEGTTEQWVSSLKAYELFCNENGINFYNLSTPENWAALAIDGTTDFMDTGHLNCIGATKVSRMFAGQLQKDYDLPDHRGDSAYSTWDEDWNLFYENNKDVLTQFGY